MELRHRIRAWRRRRSARHAVVPTDPYAQSLATASHLVVLRRSLTTDPSTARWYR